MNATQELPRHYGYVPDRYDGRDLDEVELADSLDPIKPLDELPKTVDLRDSGKLPEVWDQGQIGSCTAHGTLGGLLYIAALDGVDVPMLARLWVYQRSLMAEGSFPTDAGARVRDVVKLLAANGAPPESEYPYDTSKLADAPPDALDNDAHEYFQTVQYYRVLPSVTRICNRLAQGFAIVDGMPVYESMESAEVAQSGVVPMPVAGERMLGGHCTLTVGYDLDKQVFVKRNSWGSGWGQEGYFTLPFAYSRYLSDRWAFRSVA